MKTNWKALGTIGAIVLAQALRAWAAPDGIVNVSDGADLVDEVNNGTATTLNVPIGSYAVTAPLRVNRTLTVAGTIDTANGELPTDVTITKGAPAPGECFGNVVTNPGFEASSGWTETVSAGGTTPVITANTTAPAPGPNSGTQYALFTRPPTATTGVPLTGMRLTDSRQIDLTNVAGMGSTITEYWRDWPVMLPYPNSPFPVELRSKNPLVVNALSNYAQTLKSVYDFTMPAVAVIPQPDPVAVVLWVYAPAYNPGDSLEIVDTVNGNPTVMATIDGANVGAYKAGYAPLRVTFESGVTVPGTHSLSVVANLNGATGAPTLFLIGAAAWRHATTADVAPPNAMGSNVVALGGAIAPLLPAPYNLPHVIPVNGADPGPAALYNTIFPIVRFGGLGWPQVSFEARQTVVGGNVIVTPFYNDGSVDQVVGTFTGLSDTCTSFSAAVPVGASLAGVTLGFDVFIDIMDPSRSACVIDNVSATVISTDLAKISTTLYSPAANNLVVGGDFESGGWIAQSKPLGTVLTPKVVVTTPLACAGSGAAVFDPMALTDPVKLFVQAQVKQAGTSAETLSMNVSDTKGHSLTRQILDGTGAVGASALVDAAFDLTFDRGVTVTFSGTTSTDGNVSTRAVFVLEAAQASTIDLTAPLAPTDFSAGTQDDSWFKPKGFAAPKMLLADRTIRFGGIHQAALEYKLTALDKAGGDTLRLVNSVLGTAVALAETGADCASTAAKPIKLDDAWLASPFALGFESSIQPAVAPAKSTTFVLDDLCVGYLDRILATLDPALAPCVLDENFDSGGATWAETVWYGVPDPPIVRTGPCGSTAAVFTEVPAPPVIAFTLEHTGPAIVVPDDPSAKLTLQVREANRAAGDELKVTVSDTDAASTITPVEQTLTGGSGAYAEQTVDLSTLAGKTVKLLFTAAVSVDPANPGTPGSFAVDDVCLAAPDGALITVESAGRLTLKDLTVSAGKTNVAVTGAGFLNMLRCRMENATDTGLLHAGTSSIGVASCVFEGNGVAVLAQSGLITLFQDAIFGDVQAAGGAARVIACIVDGGGLSGSASSYISWISGAKGTENASLPNLDTSIVTPDYLSGGWKGQLNTQLPSGKTVNDLASLTLPSGWETDFAGESRGSDSGSPVQVGADEVYVAMLTNWSYTVTPPVIGKNTVATIEVTADSDLSTFDLVMVPEMPEPGMAGDKTLPAHRIVVASLGTGNTATATVSFGAPFNNGICTDGAVRFYLVQRADGSVMVDPSSWGPLTIDTLPPRILYVSDTPSLGSNDIAYATEGPTGWAGKYVLPMSGPDNVNVKDKFAFIDNSVLGSLNLTVSAQFEDQYPEDIASGYSFTVTRSAMIDPLPEDLNASGFTMNLATVTAVVSGGVQKVTWTSLANAVPGGGIQQVSFRPTSRDEAGNTSDEPPHSLVAVCMPMPTAVFQNSSTPDGSQTTTPHFEWKLNPSLPLTDTQKSPVKPAVAFRLTTVNIATGSPVMLCDWTWVSEPSIKGSTMIDATRTVDTVLKTHSSTPSYSPEVTIEIRGGDEAGNVQPGTGHLETRTWINRDSQAPTSVDTEASVKLFHLPKNWKPGDGVVRSFGSMARVPLPGVADSKNGVYTSALINLTALLPGQFNDSAGQININGDYLSVIWQLYEDGALVASGLAVPSAGGERRQMSFYIPDSILNPQTGVSNCDLIFDQVPKADVFLRIGPDGVQNRLGDEINRQREVYYTLVAKTRMKVPIPNSTDWQDVVDNDPATVTFTLYPPGMLEKLREEQPVRIYERR